MDVSVGSAESLDDGVTLETPTVVESQGDETKPPRQAERFSLIEWVPTFRFSRIEVDKHAVFKMAPLTSNAAFLRISLIIPGPALEGSFHMQAIDAMTVRMVPVRVFSTIVAFKMLEGETV